MNLYVASSWRNTEQPMMVAMLRLAGHEVYDFRHPHLGPAREGFQWAAIDPDWESWSAEQFRDALRHPLAVKGFISDRAGMDWADCCVLLLPCGRSAHLEAGWMAGTGKPVFVALRVSEPELMYGLLGHLCVTDSELLAAIAEAAESA